jgi:hypothetical protein
LCPVRRTLLDEASVVFDWIVIGVLYVAGIGFFRFIGGLDSASDGLRRWGATYAERRRASNRMPSAFRSSSRDRRDS